MRKQENYENTLGNRYQGSASCGFFGRGQKALGREWPGFHWACVMERSATSLFYSSCYFLRINCHGAAHTGWSKTWVHCNHWWLQKPYQAPAVAEIWVHPHTSRAQEWHLPLWPLSGNHKVIPRITLLGGYMWWIHSWIFMTSEYLTAIDRKLPGDPSSW